MKNIHAFALGGGLILLLLLIFSSLLWAKGGEDLQSLTSPDGLYNRISQGDNDYILVDVRTREEYQGGHIPTATNIPYDKIGENPPTLDKDMTIILYCRSGRRSSIAYIALENMGFTNLYDFQAAYRWKEDFTMGSEPGSL